jgi:hypothetical protein
MSMEDHDATIDDLYSSMALTKVVTHPVYQYRSVYYNLRERTKTLRWRSLKNGCASGVVFHAGHKYSRFAFRVSQRC